MRVFAAVAGVLLACALAAYAAPQALPKANQVPGTHWGYAPVDKAHNGSLFYWMFEAETNPSAKPLVLWLTGGPGCSSELALFFENGPFTVNSDLSLKPNPYSWTKVANVIWLDQPVGTGFSYIHDGAYVHNETQVAEDVHTALKFFLAKYPQYAKMPFYVTGESYGGHYVSSVSERVSRDHTINFKGLAIGNGWVDPEVQYKHYVDQALYGGIITQAQADNVNQMVPPCIAAIQKKEWSSAFEICSPIVGTILQDAGLCSLLRVPSSCASLFFLCFFPFVLTFLLRFFVNL
jgi:serine carboxypeptidase-like clade IV